MKYLLILTLLFPTTLLANFPTEEKEIRYRLSNGDLLLDMGTCLVISNRLLTEVTDQWQVTTATPSWDTTSCVDQTWTVKPYRAYPDRPTYTYRDQVFTKTDQRIPVGSVCSGEVIKPCKRCDVKMIVGSYLGEEIYASCVSD